MWKLHFLFIGPKSAKFQALLILQKEIYIFPKTSDEMKSEDFAELLGDEFVYDSEQNDGFPILKWEKE